MAEVLLDEQGTPATPAAGQMLAYPDSSSSTWVQRADDGTVQGDASRAAIAQQAGFAADTYITRSGLLIPSCSMQPGMAWIWEMVIVKTAAGVAVPSWVVRVGAAGAIGDAARLTIATAAQTAVADTAHVRVMLTCRTVAVGGVIQGLVWIQHNLAATGFANAGPAGLNIVQGTSAGFDNTALGGQFVGLSVNGGAAAAWTIEQCLARVWYG